MKINVVGISGSGKSTFSAKLASKLSVPHIEMDSLYWKANWKPNPLFLRDLTWVLIANPKGYVLDGNYSSSDHLKVSDVELIIWLDYSFSISFYRCFTRTASRVFSSDFLWNGNKETIRNVISKNSILYFMITHYHKNKEKLLTDMITKSNIKCIRLCSSKEAEKFLNTFN